MKHAKQKQTRPVIKRIAPYILLIVSVAGLTGYLSLQALPQRKLTVEVLDSSFRTTDPGPFKPGNGRGFAIAKIRLNNKLGRSVYISPVTQFKVVTSNGKEEHLWPATLDSPLGSGYLQNSTSTEGQISFNIPKDQAQNIRLVTTIDQTEVTVNIPLTKQ